MTDTILLVIFGGVMTLFLIAAIAVAASRIVEVLRAMIYASTETILEQQEKNFRNAEGDRRNIESRLHWVKYRQRKSEAREKKTQDMTRRLLKVIAALDKK